jgi:hypothetical protein
LFFLACCVSLIASTRKVGGIDMPAYLVKFSLNQICIHIEDADDKADAEQQAFERIFDNLSIPYLLADAEVDCEQLEEGAVGVSCGFESVEPEETTTGKWFAVRHRAYDAVYWGPFDSLEEGHRWADEKNIDFGIGFVQMNNPDSPERTWW